MTLPPSSAPDTQKLHWVDAHCHLQDPRLDPHRPQVLERAAEAGVGLVHVAATSESDWPAVAALADAHPEFVLCSFGLHPWFIHDRHPHWLDHLRDTLAGRPAGIGEIGLDGGMDDGLEADRDAVFLAQLDLSFELALPASIHCRGAWGRMLDILLARPPHPAGLLLHAYAGPPDALPALAAKNVHISFGGTLTRPNAKKALKNAKKALKNRFLVESDAPDLPPTLAEGQKAYFRDENGKILSEPAYIPYIGQLLADLRGTTPAQIAAETTATARRLFAPLLT
ncbi:MAG: TatD family hydrolase [Kiritimatiellae bacterium]|nr:TatD family hydrolase [Kiritimatiellia bacterium]MDD4341963.1 TatD family hydrolase [Kiritimatiellia bacterium]